MGELADFDMDELRKARAAVGLTGTIVVKRRTQDGGYTIVANSSGIYPTEFKVLIAPKPVDEKIGAIYVPQSKQDSDKYATTEGRIVAISHLAFGYASAEEWGDHKPKPGDRVLYAKYAGVRHKGKDGVDYVLVNDKDVVAVLE